MTRFRVIVFLFVGFFILIFLTFFLTKNLIKTKIYERTKEFIDKKLKTEVNFSKVDTNFIDRLIFSNVSVPEYNLRAKRVAVKFSIISIILKKKIVPSIQLESAFLELDFSKKNKKKKKFKIFLPEYKIRIKNGTLSIKYKNKVFIKKINGFISPRLRISLKTENGSKIFLKGRRNIRIFLDPLKSEDLFYLFGLKSKGDIRTDLKFDLEDFSFGYGEGSFEFRIENPYRNIDKIEGNFIVRNGVWNFNNFDIKSNNLKLSFRGSVKDVLSGAFLNFKYNACGELNTNRGFFKDIKGKLDVSGVLKGRLKNPFLSIKGSIIDGRFKGIDFVDSDFSLFYNRYSRPYFDIDKFLIFFKKGKLTASGFWGKRGNLSCDIDGVKLGKFWGRFDGKLRIEKKNGTLSLYMPLSIRDIGFYPDLKGKVNYISKKGNFYFSSGNKDYVIKGDFSVGNGIVFNEFIFDLYGDGLVKGDGYFKEFSDSSFNLTAKNVNVKDLSFLNIPYKGDFSFEGRIVNPGRNFDLKGNFLGEIEDKNIKYRLSAGIEYSRNKIKIKNMFFSDFLEGNFTYVKEPFIVKGKFRLNEFPISFLKFLKLKGDSTGFIDFYIDKKIKKFNIDFKTKDFNFKNFYIDNFYLKGSMKGNNFIISNINIEKNVGKISGNGELNFGSKDGRIELSLKDVPVLKKKLNTSLDIKLDYSYNPFYVRGKISSDSIFLGREIFKNFSSNFSYKGKDLKFYKIKTGDFDGYLKINRNSFSGNFNIKSRIKRIVNIFSMGKIPLKGDISGEINFKKTENLKGEAKFNLSEFYFYDLKGKGNIDFEFNDNVIELKESDFKFEKNFLATFSGIIPINKKFNYNLKGNIRNFPLSNFGLKGFDSSFVKIYLKNEKTKPVIDGTINFEKGDFLDFTLYLDKNLKPDKSIITSSLFNVLEGNIKTGKGLIDFKNNVIELNLFLRHIRLKGFSLWGDVYLKSDILLKNGSARIDNFYFNGFNLNEVFLKFSRQKNSILFLPQLDKKVYITGKILWDKNSFSFSPIKLISGKRVLKAELYKKESDLKLDFSTLASRFSGKDIFGMLDVGFPFDGESEVDLKVEKKNNNLKLKGKVKSYNGKIGELNFKKLVSNFSFDNEKIYLELVVYGDDFNLKGKGDIYIRKKLSNFNLSLKADSLSPLFLFNIPENKGRLLLNLNFSGSLNEPIMEGNIFAKGEFLGPFGKKVKEFDLKGKFYQDKIIIDEVKGKSPGEFTGNGWLSFKDMKISDGKIILNIKDGVYIKSNNLIIPAEGLAKKFIKGRPSHGKIKGKLILFLKDIPEVKGDIVLYNAQFTYPGKKGRFLNFPLVLDIKVKTGDNVYFRNNFSEILIKADLNFKKEINRKILVNGKIESLKGKLLYIGKNFDIRRAEIDFVDNVPYLEGEAVTDVERLEPSSFGREGITVKDKIVLEIKRDILGKTRPTFYSLYYGKETSEEKAMALLFGGANINELSLEEKERLLRREIVRIFDSSLTSPLIKNLLEKTGLIDTVSVKVPLVTELDKKNKKEFLEGTELKFGRHITNRFFWGYNIKIGSSYEGNKLNLTHEFEFFYRMRGRQFLKGRMELQKGKEGEKYLGIENQFRF